MKRIYLTLISILLAIPLLAQTHNDYIEDGVSGGVDRAFNGILWMIIIVVVLVVLLFVSGGILKIYYWFNPDKKVTREQEIKVLSDLLDKATEKKEASKPVEKVAKQEEPVKTEVKKPTPKPEVKFVVPLEIKGIRKKVCGDIFSDRYCFTQIESILAGGKFEVKDKIGEDVFMGTSDEILEDEYSNQIETEYWVIPIYDEDFKYSKLHLGRVNSKKGSVIYDNGLVAYDNTPIFFHSVSERVFMDIVNTERSGNAYQYWKERNNIK